MGFCPKRHRRGCPCPGGAVADQHAPAGLVDAARKRSTFGTRRARPLTIPAQEGRCYPTPPRSGRRSGRSGV